MTKRAKMFRRFIISIVVIAFLVGLVSAFGLYMAATKMKSRFPVEIEVQRGSSARRIAEELAREMVIRAPKLFELLARAKDLCGKLQAGLYEFPPGTTLVSALGKLEKGDVKAYPFTVIEGWTAKEIAEHLANQPYIVSPDVPSEFLRLVNDRAFIDSIGFVGVKTLEGYLFPDTYFVTKPLTTATLIKQMVAKFVEVWNSLAGAPQDVAGRNKVVTLASVVEKETGLESERPVIAGVFVNRLVKGIPLQSDPTIIYGIQNFDGNIRMGDIRNPHPYNTYVHAGLPPGPICNPGKGSLEAALHPAQINYLFFVSKNDGSHEFSTTLAEHSKAVNKYQKNREE